MDNTLKAFEDLHNRLQTELTRQQRDESLLSVLITKYIAQLVDSPSSGDIFDLFCQINGVAILDKLLQVSPLLAVKSLALLLINLKEEILISYLMCQPFMTAALELNLQEQEQWAEYYISFLKSLSIRLTHSQISLFYNKKYCKFPLVWQAIQYFNYPELMVRTNVMNIILEIMRIPDEKCSHYFSSFPFTSYILSLACDIATMVRIFTGHLVAGTVTPALTKTYCVDLTDDLLYLKDIYNIASPRLTFFLDNAVLAYLVIPAFHLLLTQCNHSQLITHQFFLLFKLYDVLQSKTIMQTILHLMTERQINTKWMKKMTEQIVIPLACQVGYQQKGSYWHRFDKQISAHCLMAFKDLVNFQVDQELQESDPALKAEFDSEILRISNFIGFNILTYEPVLTGENPLTSLIDMETTETEMSQNSFYQIVFQTEQSSNIARQNILSCLFISLLQFQNSNGKYIINKSLDKTNLPSNNQCVNKQIFKKVQTLALQQLESIRKGQVHVLQIHLNIILLDQCLNCIGRQLTPQEKSLVQQIYLYMGNKLREYMLPQNIITIVDNFHAEYTKYMNSYNTFNGVVPYTLLLPNTKQINNIEGGNQLTLKDDKIIQCIRSFALLQAFYLRLQQVEANFEQMYHNRFSKTTNLWRVNRRYKIEYRNMLPCMSQQKDRGKKLLKTMIIQDDHNLVVVEPSSQKNEARIILNTSWKHVIFSICKDEGHIIEVKHKDDHEVLWLLFDDQVRSNVTFGWMNDLKRKSYQEEQSFILSFLRHSLTHD